MSEQPSQVGSATSGPTAFDERLSVPAWWYLPAAGLGLLLGAEIHMGFPGVRSWIGYVVLIPFCLVAVWWMGRSTVRVHGDRLVAGGSTVLLSQIGRIDTVGRADKQDALGPQLDPTAFVLHRSWIGSVVRMEITDPASAVPYWVVSSRRPDDLVAALGDGGHTDRPAQRD